MSGERVDPNELIEATGLDIRGVSVIWTDKTDDESRPIPDYFGCSEFEALGMAQALVRYLERVCDIDAEDDDDDDDGREEDPPNDDGPPPSAPGRAKRLESRVLSDA